MSAAPAAPGVRPVKRALVSVFDKAGVVDLATGLHRLGVSLVSTGSTAAHIASAAVPVTEVAQITGYPECLDGRVKTLHPRIHAGILADRSKPSHRSQLDTLDIEPIDLVVVNLYPFEKTVGSSASNAEVIEMIDIGGPTLVRAAAKNHAGVGVLVDPADYRGVLDELRERGGLTDATRHHLAAKAFAHTAAYDAAIAAWFQRDEVFPAQFGPTWRRVQTLRYGENPHQRAAWYADASGEPWGLASATQHQGKELSYNNLLDADAAWGMVCDFDEPCVAIVKHNNPAGLAVAPSLVAAYGAALEGDPMSAYGGIVAANRPIDEQTAKSIVEVFTEVLIAPGYGPGALEVLSGKTNLRVLEVSRPVVGVVRDDPERASAPPAVLRSIRGGLLVQDADLAPEPFDAWRVAGNVSPDEKTMRELRFAWQVCKHVKSNAIVLTRDLHVVGIGAGQMSRVDAVRLALQKAEGRAEGAVLASDAFFPFRDGPDLAAAGGVRAIVQPGGSVRDAEVIASADEHGIPIVLTGRRHFRH